MFKCFAASILFTLMTSACLSAVPTIKILQDNAALCPRASAPPVIDGRLDDACWRSGPQIARFMRLDEYKPAREQTSVYLAYDDQALYVAFKCTEPEMPKLSATLKTDIWHDDSVEVFIDPTRDRRHYMHFVASAAGVKYQEIGENIRENLNQRWEAQWDAAVSLGANEWSAEIRIPWAIMGVTPQNGIAIRANFGRNELGLKEVSTWNVMLGGFHQPLMFGNVILGDKASAIVTDLTLPGEAHTGVIKGELTLINTGRAPVSVSPIVQVLPSMAPMSQPGEPSRMEPGWRLQCPVTLDLPEAKLYNLDVFVQEKGQDDPVFVASYQLNVPPAPPEALGATLNETDWGSVWEACATFKVMPDQKLPTSREQTIAVSAAKNEFEPFQIVLTPRKELKNLRASVSDLKGNETIPSSRVSIKLVETVPVTIPTSPDCLLGDYPDPLPPFAPTDIPAGKNTALWFTVYVPTNAAAGDYTGAVTLEADGISPVRIPVALHVWNFALPKISHLRTAYGHDPGALSSWQGVSNPEDQRRVAELLNQDFIEHRISPYTPMSLWDPKVEVSGEEVKVDWTEFDKGAAMFLPKMNSFNLPFAWLGDFFGAKQGTPEYRKLKGAFLKNMAAHLKEKGWFDKGYIYIFDEPVPDQYQMIV
ncbi:MAG: DUF6067 family protein, partial [Armatimonadetes bacterium]|nr:DUF6067 family protein [Armatimonadota bacterium]